jgi:20S proteasome alpha/beta subunit
MTAIVGIENNGSVLMGSDTCASTDFDKISLDTSKVFNKNQILFGYCGSSRFEDIIQYHAEFPQHDSETSDREYLIKYVITEIRRILIEHGLRSENDGAGQMALLGYNGKLYYVSPDFSLTRDPRGYAAVGSGQSVAMGSLFSTDRIPNIDARTRIQMALEAAESHARGVHAPFNVTELR